MGKDVELIFSHSTANGGSGELGVDKNGNLYWNNKKVITEKKVSLNWAINAAIIAGGISTVVIALITALQALGVVN